MRKVRKQQCHTPVTTGIPEAEAGGSHMCHHACLWGHFCAAQWWGRLKAHSRDGVCFKIHIRSNSAPLVCSAMSFDLRSWEAPRKHKGLHHPNPEGSLVLFCCPQSRPPAQSPEAPSLARALVHLLCKCTPRVSPGALNLACRTL